MTKKRQKGEKQRVAMFFWGVAGNAGTTAGRWGPGVTQHTDAATVSHDSEGTILILAVRVFFSLWDPVVLLLSWISLSASDYYCWNARRWIR